MKWKFDPGNLINFCQNICVYCRQMYPYNKYKEKGAIKYRKNVTACIESRKPNRISGRISNIFIILMFLYKSIYASIHIKKSGKSEASEKTNLAGVMVSLYGVSFLIPRSLL
jgi:hypothetical protein